MIDATFRLDTNEARGGNDHLWHKRAVISIQQAHHCRTETEREREGKTSQFSPQAHEIRHQYFEHWLWFRPAGSATSGKLSVLTSSDQHHSCWRHINLRLQFTYFYLNPGPPWNPLIQNQFTWQNKGLQLLYTAEAKASRLKHNMKGFQIHRTHHLPDAPVCRIY